MVPLPTSQRLARKHDLYWALSRIMTKGIDQEACTCNTRGITSCTVIARQLPTRAVAQHQCLLISAELWQRKKKRKGKKKKKKASRKTYLNRFRVNELFDECMTNDYFFHSIHQDLLSFQLNTNLEKDWDSRKEKVCVCMYDCVCARARVCVCTCMCVRECASMYS